MEPEYAFDIPSSKWLLEWFLVSLGLLALSAAVAGATKQLAGSRLSSTAAHWLFWILAFFLGALGTSVLSPWRGDFVFTWPLCLFVAFQAAVYEMRWRTAPDAPRRFSWRSRLVLLLFFGVCVAYFFICRRLSLVFEWSFLCGFGAALPLVAAGAFSFRESRWRTLWEVCLSSLGFAAFYWSAALVLWWKS